jgi:signal transduction histidine kinase
LFSQNEQQFNRWMLVGLISGFILLIAGFALVATGLRNSNESARLVRHTFEVKDAIGDLTVALERSEAARRGYLVEPDPYRRQVYEKWAPQIVPSLNRLEELVSDSPAQSESVRRLRPIVIKELAEVERSMDLATSGDLVTARAEFSGSPGLSTLQIIRDRARRINAIEEGLLLERQEEARDQQNFVQLLLLLTGVLLAGVAAFTFWLVRKFTRDLLDSQKRLHRLNTDLEGAVKERTADLQRANDEIQRFAYIVSHDLRSPLVNVMGFTSEMERADKIVADFVTAVEDKQPELVSDEVRFAAREDLPEAIGFIRSSTRKMDRLINAILDLSRQGRRVLTPEMLPMDRLIGDIAANLEVLAAERDARFIIEEPMPSLRHDRLAVEQIFSNLMENATKYLQSGRQGVIMVRGRREGSRAIFEVEDNGRGIAPADHERIFELFRRSGQQDQQGEGIGLANVRALAYRLGGTITVRSVLSEGSTFVVDLPVEFSEEGKDQ